ncbi:DUF6247 family protein [Kibdelosporangium persicum]|uniref:DUF6247 family protein n=1 Tax=Kibdelosporangium persicum TaxID=2698649 RepID=UPI001FEB4946|nr:DUF6247 family protein [Kibdelosporangium persicum]
MGKAPVPPGPFPCPDEDFVTQTIRAALLPDEVAAFDRDCRRALKAAAESQSLGELHRTLEHWRRIARMTRVDPEAHRRMLRRAEHILRTGEPVKRSVPADQVKGLIRERLGR